MNVAATDAAIWQWADDTPESESCREEAPVPNVHDVAHAGASNDLAPGRTSRWSRSRITAAVGASAAAIGLCVALPAMAASSAAATTAESSIWSTSATPQTASWSDNLAVEVGVRFVTSTPGSITGLRFY